MQLDRAYERIKASRPRLIHISGKTSTGKSTFAKRLANELGYVVVELDQVFVGQVMPQLGLSDQGQAFVQAYKLRDQPKIVAAFVRAAQTAINEQLAAGRSVVVDGAVANPETLHELFAPYGGFMFVYFHPADLDVYTRNLTSRFMTSDDQQTAGLPQYFWQLMGVERAKEFHATRKLTPAMQGAIREYALASRQESERRAVALETRFPHLIKVTI